MGVDPGLYFTGIGIIGVENGVSKHIFHDVIELPEKIPVASKLQILGDKITQLIGAHKPAILSLEKAFFGKNADSAFKLGLVRGVVMAESARAQTRVLEFAARAVKKGIAGHGNADKETLALFVQRILKIDISARRDATDALALALFAWNYCDNENLMRMRGIEI